MVVIKGMVRFKNKSERRGLKYDDYVQMEWGREDKRTAWALILSKRVDSGWYEARALMVEDGRVTKRAYGGGLSIESLVGKLEVHEITIAKLYGLSLDNPDVVDEDSDKWFDGSDE
jgi:hypothetical protein